MCMKPGRNDPCSCGSGKKYKNCCEGKVASSMSVPSSAEINALIVLYNAGRYAEAESGARMLVGRRPSFGFGWKLLGGALQMQGKNALPAFQKTAELMPGEANAHSNLGAVLYGLGKYDEALSSYRKAMELKPAFAGSHYNLGKILSECGKLEEAVACYRRAIDIQPDFAMAHYNLGNALKDLGQPDGAVASYRKSLQIDPGFLPAYVNLGVVLQGRSQFSEAASCYRRALEIEQNLADIHSNLGHVLKHLGEFDAAMASYRRAIGIDPGCIEATLGAGLLCMENGEMEEAESLFQRALKINVRDMEARYLLAQVKKVDAGDENFSTLVALEENARNKASSTIEPLSDSDAIKLYFALGKCCDDVGDHDQAFRHYIKGCQLKRATLAYDAERTAQYFSDIIGFFDRATIERLRGGGDPSRVPVFVLGMPRSGTTLTEQIIASHPDIRGAGELPDLLMAIKRGAARIGARFPDDMSALGLKDLAVWAEDYVAGLLKRAPDAKRITDKMPENYLAVGLIHLMLPNAKIIHVNRNPVDTCLSCFTKLFNSGAEYSYDLAELGRYYGGYARLMAHWRSVLPAGAFLDVQYEEIVADQETQARRMIAFCGLEWSDACIDFHHAKNAVRTASLTQVRQPIYGSSVNRWKRYQKHLAPLLEALGDLVPK